MNKDIAMKWADALESGEYPQIKSFLHTADGYCCLGVLCELSGFASWKEEDIPWLDQAGLPIRFKYPDGTGLTSKYSLPYNVMEWSGVRTSSGEVLSEDNTLASLNDKGKTFTEIAQIIRENWENL